MCLALIGNQRTRQSTQMLCERRACLNDGRLERPVASADALAIIRSIHRMWQGAMLRRNDGAQLGSGLGVRRAKAAFSSGCNSHPATAPAGSNRSSYGGNEMAEAFG